MLFGAASQPPPPQPRFCRRPLCALSPSLRLGFFRAPLNPSLGLATFAFVLPSSTTSHPTAGQVDVREGVTQVAAPEADLRWSAPRYFHDIGAKHNGCRGLRVQTIVAEPGEVYDLVQTDPALAVHQGAEIDVVPQIRRGEVILDLSPNLRIDHRLRDQRRQGVHLRSCGRGSGTDSMKSTRRRQVGGLLCLRDQRRQKKGFRAARGLRALSSLFGADGVHLSGLRCRFELLRIFLRRLLSFFWCHILFLL
mmetsp:Transcript_75934/g.210828  ORF Transcript_75934/g.210828 Transcript_75934/m.210828 type:complete len:251 (+) Transcript_75934:229-981(+)